MPLDFPLYQPQVQPGNMTRLPPSDDFSESVAKGYQAGRILSGEQARQDALKLAIAQQGYEQAGQMFPLQLALEKENLQNAPVNRALAITKAFQEPGIVPNATTGPVVPVGTSPMALTEQFAAPKGEGQVPSDTLPANIPGYPTVGVSNAKVLQEKLREKAADDERFYRHYDYAASHPKMTAAMVAPVDQNALNGALEYYRTTGQMPAFGWGQSSLRNAFFAALGGANPEDKDVVNEGVKNKAVRAGLSKAYGTQQNIYQATKTSINTLEKQLDLAESLSQKVDRTGVPVLNRYILKAKGNYAGDEDTKAFENAVRTASFEFGKILAGSAASVAGTPVTTAEDAKQLIDTSFTTGQFSRVKEQMKTEGGFRLKAYEDTLKDLDKELGSVGKKEEPGSKLAETKSSFLPNHRYRDKSTGEIFITDARGNRVK